MDYRGGRGRGVGEALTKGAPPLLFPPPAHPNPAPFVQLLCTGEGEATTVHPSRRARGGPPEVRGAGPKRELPGVAPGSGVPPSPPVPPP